jgi:hypothetical protein
MNSQPRLYGCPGSWYRTHQGDIFEENLKKNTQNILNLVPRRRMGRSNRILRIQILSIQKKNLSKKNKTSEYFLFGRVKKADQKPHGP